MKTLSIVSRIQALADRDRHTIYQALTTSRKSEINSVQPFVEPGQSGFSPSQLKEGYAHNRLRTRGISPDLAGF